jgi:hypothetical protein
MVGGLKVRLPPLPTSTSQLNADTVETASAASPRKSDFIIVNERMKLKISILHN